MRLRLLPATLALLLLAIGGPAQALLGPHTTYAGWSVTGPAGTIVGCDTLEVGVGGACYEVPQFSVVSVDVHDVAGRPAPFRLTVTDAQGRMLAESTHCGLAGLRVPAGTTRVTIAVLDPVSGDPLCADPTPTLPAGRIRFGYY